MIIHKGAETLFDHHIEKQLLPYLIEEIIMTEDLFMKKASLPYDSRGEMDWFNLVPYSMWSEDEEPPVIEKSGSMMVPVKNKILTNT